MLRVRNMLSERSSREVANQFIIESENKVMFQSYDSPIVEIDEKHKTITVYRDWDYSTTTSKYRNQFMNENGFYELSNKKDFEKYMNLGVYDEYDIIKAF